MPQYPYSQTPALHGDERLTSRCGCFTLLKRTAGTNLIEYRLLVSHNDERELYCHERTTDSMSVLKAYIGKDDEL
jgi:hypothetical protein